MENEIGTRHGKMNTTEPKTGISKIYLDEDDAARHGLYDPGNAFPHYRMR